jgi:hypothetical protein
MDNFAVSLTVMGFLRIFFLLLLLLFLSSSSVAESSSVPSRPLALACSPFFSCSWPEAPCRGRRTALGCTYILHHSQPRAERRVRGPGGLGAEFSRDPGPGKREGHEWRLGWGGPACIFPYYLVCIILSSSLSSFLRQGLLAM